MKEYKILKECRIREYEFFTCGDDCCCSWKELGEYVTIYSGEIVDDGYYFTDDLEDLYEEGVDWERID